ncbi:hypothetical protein BH20BAC1_BH20BAC1_00650 [soil metagenome]
MPKNKEVEGHKQTLYAESVIDLFNEPLILLTKDLRVRHANNTFYKTFGFHRGKSVGKDFYELGKGSFNIRVVQDLLDQIGSDDKIDEIEIEYQKKNRPTKILLVNGKKVKIRGINETLILLVIEDITLKRNFEEQAEKQKDIIEEIRRLRTMSRQKDDFISMASHELKTPVTSIKAFAQLLENDFAKEGNKQAANMLARMNVQIVKLTGLIGDLLDVSRMDSGKLQYHFNYYDLNDLIGEVVREIQPSAKTHQINCKLGQLPDIYCDRDRIGQVLNNFLTNAIKYSPEAKEIIVISKPGKIYITVSVKDFGYGIPKEEQSNIFKKFYRVHEIQDNTFPGIGLGLYISSEIIKKHNGLIGLRNTPGKGSTFFFKLPVNPRQHF